MAEEQKKDQKNFTRRDRLMELEKDSQALWEKEGTNKIDPIQGKKKFFMTFPYPYLNGRLHLGHVYSMTKCDFTCRYKRAQGYNTLFPQGFHCTGMPIQAAANKLKQEMEQFGFPPKFPVEPKDKVYQYQIMEKLNIPQEEIPKFTDAYYWTTYFPPYAMSDLKYFGAPVDWRRSFITTDINPYYDSFIKWQFNILKQKNYISFGKRPSIFSVKDKQMCADHDRSEGEGVGPQEYTLIKLQVLDFPKKSWEQLKGRKVFMVTGTLRPETMYGQTNCFVLPSGTYGAFEMQNDEVFICTERSARNMSYQGITKVEKEIHQICEISGEDLLGIPLKAPYSTFEKIYSLPMLTISMTKGTGIVTSVPSDSPDDFAALRDLQKKEALRQKYGLTDEMVLPFSPIPIIDIPGYGDMAGPKIVEELKIQSQNDKEKLKQAKEFVYQKGFYEGILIVGKYKGTQVQEAKNLVKNDLLNEKLAVQYYEPENLVVSRSGDECIVALCDQWYLKYSDEIWTEKVLDHVNNTWKTFEETVRTDQVRTIKWLKDWGCSRSFGLGTRLPFDEQYLIESLSDSTIYMAYYTVAHFLQGDVPGTIPGTMGIKAQDLTHETWDYIFLEGEFKADKIKVPEDQLKIMRESFQYWYPMDLRCSAKDLIRNHLTMALFNHAAIWDTKPELWPRSYFVNGYILVNGEKMAKSRGNFFTLRDVVDMYGADATRFAMAEAGDTQDDANFEQKNADDAVLRISTLEMWLKANGQTIPKLRQNSDGEKLKFFDAAFDSEMRQLYLNTLGGYEKMRFRDVTKYGFHNFNGLKDEYLCKIILKFLKIPKVNCGESGPKQQLIIQWIDWQLTLMYPIIPHFCEFSYREYFLKFVSNPENYHPTMNGKEFYTIDPTSIDTMAIRKFKSLQEFLRNSRLAKAKAALAQVGKKNKDKAHEVKFTKLAIVYTDEYHEWQKYVLGVLGECQFDEEMNTKDDWKTPIKINPEMKGEMQKKCMEFGSFIIKVAKEQGKDAFELKIPFNEVDVIKNNIESLNKEFGITVDNIEFVHLKEASKNKDQNWQGAIKECVPGKALVVFFD